MANLQNPIDILFEKSIKLNGEMYFYDGFLLHDLLEGDFEIFIEDKNFMNWSYIYKITYRHKPGASPLTIEKINDILNKFVTLRHNDLLFNVVFFSETKVEKENDKFDFSFSIDNCNFSKYDNDYYSMTLILTSSIDDLKLRRENINPRFY